MHHTLDYPSLALEAIEQGGFTQALDGWRPSTGYVVSTRPDAEVTVRADRYVVANALYVFVINNGYDLRHGYLIGAWRDDDKVVLDLVQVFDDRETAMIFARNHGQRAIYDVESNDALDVEPRWHEPKDWGPSKTDLARRARREDNGRGDELTADE